MKNIFSLVKKDLKLQIRNPFLMLAFFVVPIIILIFTGYISFSSSKSLTIVVDERLKEKFNQKKSLDVTYLNENSELNITYHAMHTINKKILNKDIEVAFFIEDNKEILYVNKNGYNSSRIFTLLRDYLHPVKTKDYITRIENSSNVDVITLIISFLIIMGSITMASTTLAMELENQTVVLLLKCGYHILEIFIAKMLFILVIEVIFFSILYFLIIQFFIIENVFLIIFIIPFIICSASLVGLFISSLTTRREMQSIFLMLFLMPAVLYSRIENGLPLIIKSLLNLNPIVNCFRIISSSLKNNVEVSSIFIGLLSFVLFLVVSYFLLKKNIKKNV